MPKGHAGIQVFSQPWCELLFLLSILPGTIFAYGQTGTGKTFTMEGVRTVPELQGIIPNSFAHIFGHIAKMDGDIRYLVLAIYHHGHHSFSLIFVNLL